MGHPGVPSADHHRVVTTSTPASRARPRPTGSVTAPGSRALPRHDTDDTDHVDDVDPRALVSEQAVPLVDDDVAPAPAPAVTVGTADDGTVAPAPTPVALRVLTAARWLGVLLALQEG